MPNAIRAAALAGRTCREQIGALPDDLDVALEWAWRELGIVADWSAILGPGRDGFCYAIPGNGTRGRVLLSQHAHYPRLTLAHEVGHLMLANGAAFSMVCQQYQMLLPEREAMAFAVMFLLPDGELCEWFARRRKHRPDCLSLRRPGCRHPRPHATGAAARRSAYATAGRGAGPALPG